MADYNWEAEYMRVARERDAVKDKLDAMTRYRDNAALRMSWAERERDEARAERDALLRALIRRGGGREYALNVARLARVKFAKTETLAPSATGAKE